MEYRTKLKIADAEIMDSVLAAEGAPFIAGVKLKNSTALSAMEIGATASDCLYFSLYNPFKTSFDGDTVELFISAIGDSSEVVLEEIAESVGANEFIEAIDEDESIALEDDSEDGEEMTAEEIAEAEQTEAENIESTYDFFNGENDTVSSIETSEEAEEEWIKIGTFYVFNQTNSTKDNSIMFECLDAFSLLNDKFEPTVTKATVQALYEDYRTKVRENYGLEVDEFSFADPYNQIISWNVNCTYREAIGYFAGIVGGFAAFDSDNSLGISFYSFNDSIILSESLIDYKETSAGEVFIESLTCDRSETPYKEDVIESGYGQGLTFSNPFITQEMLDDITAYYNGIRYVGAELSLFWNETIQSGEFIRIMTRDEYANYIGLNNALERESNAAEILSIKDALNSLGKVVLISNQTINFTGNAISRVDSICDTEFKKANKITSPSDGYFKALYAEMIEAEYLKAKGAYIADLTTENLKVGSINGKAIKDSAVLAKALSQGMVETVLGVKVFYSAEPPTAENVGDIWYVTMADQDYNPQTDVIKTWDGSAWVQQEFSTPNSIFMANSIVAQDINANEVTANAGFMDLLQSRIVRVGPEDEGHIEIDEKSVDVYVEGEGVAAKFGTTELLKPYDMDSTTITNSLLQGKNGVIIHAGEYSDAFLSSGYIANSPCLRLEKGEQGVNAALTAETTDGASVYGASLRLFGSNEGDAQIYLHGDIFINTYPMQTFVKDSGIANGWNYRIWSDNTIELWKYHTGTFAMQTKAQDIFYTSAEARNITLPFHIRDAVVNATSRQTGFVYAYVESGAMTENSILYYRPYRGNSSANAERNYNFYIIGKVL